MSVKRCAVVLAAGQGTRMRSSRIKVMHPVCGRPMVGRVVDAALAAGCAPVVVVVGHQADEVRRALAGIPEVRFAVQAEQHGTGHAVRCAADTLAGECGTALLLAGDVPAIRPETLERLARIHDEDGRAVTVLSMELGDPRAYGRVVRDASGAVTRIVEARDCDGSQLAIREVNSGLYAADLAFLFGEGDGAAAGALAGLDPDNDQGELYLTDIVAAAVERGLGASAVVHGDPDEVQGINDRRQLARVEALLLERTARHWMVEGVTVREPASARIDPEARLGRDVVLGPRVEIRGASRVETGAMIDSGAVITDTTLGPGVRVGVGCVLTAADVSADSRIAPYTVMEGVDDGTTGATATSDRVRIGVNARVGPFAHLRVRSDLGAGAHLGNFVETKNTVLGPGAKANHLAYLGDGRIGPRSNVGAGVIFCNYDGMAKHRTEIGEDSFVGSDSQLVAPVRVGDRAFVGSGTTVTRDVPDGALVVTRVREKLLDGVGDRKFERIRKARAARASAAAKADDKGGRGEQ